MIEHLLVDFPSVEKQLINRTEKKRPFLPRSNAIKNLQPKDRIHFAEEAQLKFYEPCDESEKTTLWYTSRDFKAMRKETKQAAKEMQKEFLKVRKNGKSDFFENDALTGIECLLSPNITRQNRRDVMECLMAEQERQKYSLECDPDKLARAVSRHTRPAAGRARTMGLLHAKNI